MSEETITQVGKSKKGKLSQYEVRKLKALVTDRKVEFNFEKLYEVSKRAGVHPNTIKNICLNDSDFREDTVEAIRKVLHDSNEQKQTA